MREDQRPAELVSLGEIMALLAFFLVLLAGLGITVFAILRAFQ